MLTEKSECLLDRDVYGKCAVGDKATAKSVNETMSMIFMRIINILMS
jgi:hypothetical protein